MLTRVWASMCLVAALGAVALAAPLSVMSAGALEAGIRQIAAEFQRQTGDIVQIEIGNAPQLAAQLAAGARMDVLVAPAALIDQAVAEGRLVPRVRMPVGRVGVAMVIRAGQARPDVSSVDGLRRALRAADAVVYNQGSSGTYIERLLVSLGVADDVGPKSVRVLNGEAVMDRIAAGHGNELAFVAMSDAIRATGLQNIGSLPASLQNFTTYDAVIAGDAGERMSADRFLAFLATLPARRILENAGVEPAPLVR